MATIMTVKRAMELRNQLYDAILQEFLTDGRISFEQEGFLLDITQFLLDTGWVSEFPEK